MSFFSKIYEYMCAPAGAHSSDLFEATNDHLFGANDLTVINPANGLPMTGGIGGVDVAGNPYGFDAGSIHHDDSLFADNSSACDSVCSSPIFESNFDTGCSFGMYDSNSMFD